MGLTIPSSASVSSLVKWRESHQLDSVERSGEGAGHGLADLITLQ